MVKLFFLIFFLCVLSFVDDYDIRSICCSIIAYYISDVIEFISDVIEFLDER